VTPSSRTVQNFVGVLALAALAACATASGSDEPDASSIIHPTDASIDAPPGTPDGAPDAMTGAPCSTGAVCSGASSLGSIRGDNGADVQTAQGYQSAWYRLNVLEDSNGSVPVRVQARLTSPAAADFDVFVYVNVGGDTTTQECTTTLGTKNSAGNVRTVKAEWGDVFGSDESRVVSIEVRPVSGVCSVGEVWHLEVSGNWQ